MKHTGRYLAFLLLCSGLVMSACLSSRHTQPASSAGRVAETHLRDHVAHGGIATIATAHAFTAFLARHEATEKARGDLATTVDLKIATLKRELLRETGPDHQHDANNFFTAVANEMRRKVAVTSRVVFTIEEPIDGQTYSYAVVVQNPSLLLAYLDLHGAEHPTVYPLLRVGAGYRQLVRDAAAYAQFLSPSPQP